MDWNMHDRKTVDKQFSNRPDYSEMSEKDKARYRILVADTLTEILADISDSASEVAFPYLRADVKIIAMEIAEMGYRYDPETQKLVRSELWVISGSI